MGAVVQTATDYGPYLTNEPSPLHTTTIVDRCTEKLVDDWNKMRTNVSHSAVLVSSATAQWGAHAHASVPNPMACMPISKAGAKRCSMPRGWAEYKQAADGRRSGVWYDEGC